jgi:hypothetical protein
MAVPIQTTRLMRVDWMEIYRPAGWRPLIWIKK